MKIARIAAAVAFAAAAGSASAQVYGEVAYHGLAYDERAVARLDLGALGVVAGYELHPNMAVEAMLAFGVQDDAATVAVGRVSGELDYIMGLFAKPKFQVTDSFEIFARMGWARSEFTLHGLGGSVSDDGSDFAYGVGARFSIDKHVHVTGSYMNLYDKSVFKVDGWNVGLGYRF